MIPHVSDGLPRFEDPAEVFPAEAADDAFLVLHERPNRVRSLDGRQSLRRQDDVLDVRIVGRISSEARYCGAGIPQI